MQDRSEAMKPIAIFVVVAAFSLVTIAASAKTATAPQNDNERVVNTVAGPAPTPKAADAAQPTKKELKKSKVRQKPALNDPN
jgi:hypothetical protein